jgi:O-antigen/teichoic acid export membrane protein
MIVLPNVLRITLAVILIPLLGLKGAVIAFLTAEAIDYAVLGFLLRFGHKE